MNVKVLFATVFLVYFLSLQTYSQQYSFSVLAFSVYDNCKIVTKWADVEGFENHLDKKNDMDSLSLFTIKAIYSGVDLPYHRFTKHKPGIWLLYAENVRKFRPIRYFCIEKRLPDSSLQHMNIFLNYDYHSCKMPCAFGKSEFLVSQIEFHKGNYMFLSHLKLKDWSENCKNLIKIDDDIPVYIKENEIKFWDTKLKN
jgi:hypothetical protein